MSEPAQAVPTPARDVPTTGEHRAVPGRPLRRLLALDLPVAILALALLAGGWRVHAALTATPRATFRAHGLTITYPADLGLREPLAVPNKLPLHVTFRKAGDASRQITIDVGERHAVLGSLAGALELERARRYAPFYGRMETGIRSQGGRDFLRTRFRWVAPVGGGTPTEGVEYAWPADPAVNSPLSYLVTIQESDGHVTDLESQVRVEVQP